jgi:hypothetical protein
LTGNILLFILNLMIPDSLILDPRKRERKIRKEQRRRRNGSRSVRIGKILGMSRLQPLNHKTFILLREPLSQVRLKSHLRMRLRMRLRVLLSQVGRKLHLRVRSRVRLRVLLSRVMLLLKVLLIQIRVSLRVRSRVRLRVLLSRVMLLLRELLSLQLGRHLKSVVLVG